MNKGPVSHVVKKRIV